MLTEKNPKIGQYRKIFNETNWSKPSVKTYNQKNQRK